MVPTTIVQGTPLPTGPVAHAMHIAEGIHATGIGCDDASIRTGPLNGTVGNSAKEQVSCDIGHDSVMISVFADHGVLTRGLSLMRQGTCFVKATHPANLTYVQGNNWIVFPQQTGTAIRLSDALHATRQTIRC